jgi:hypothetical protein
MTRNDLTWGERLISRVVVRCAIKLIILIVKKQHIMKCGEKHRDVIEYKQRTFI